MAHSVFSQHPTRVFKTESPKALDVVRQLPGTWGCQSSGVRKAKGEQTLQVYAVVILRMIYPMDYLIYVRYFSTFLAWPECISLRHVLGCRKCSEGS